jgi:Gas vesicle synthesis protein GvpL/GvpF
MSEVHVYGVVPASERPEIASAQVRRIAHRDVAALVSDVEPGELTAAGLLRAHWRVLEEAGAGCTVLPVRFGTVMAGDRAVVDEFLSPTHDDLAARLSELAGKVQLTVKGFYEEAPLMRGVVERSPAIAKLRARVQELPEAAAYYERIELGRLVAAEVERLREQDTALVLERLEPLALATSREAASSLDTAVNAAFLVERAHVDRFSEAVGELGRELEGRMRLRYVGPLPAYSFTDDAPAGSAAWA